MPVKTLLSVDHFTLDLSVGPAKGRDEVRRATSDLGLQIDAVWFVGGYKC